MAVEDWRAVEAIYADGIATRQRDVRDVGRPTCDEFDASRLREHRLVAVDGGQRRRLGRARADVAACVLREESPSTPSTSPGGVAGRGVGRALLEALVAQRRRGRIWTIQTSMFPENAASVALHEGSGSVSSDAASASRKLDGVWRDTVLLERRLVELRGSRPSDGTRRTRCVRRSRTSC